MKPRYLTHVDQIDALSAEEKSMVKTVEEKFPFRSNEYYLSLIDWSDPRDPIRRIAVPDPMEMEESGALTSTLTLYVPSKDKWTEFWVDKKKKIYGSDDQEITLYNLMPGSDGNMNLDNPSESIWFTGSVSGYTLT